jgi:predicted dehydrogenase
MPRVRIGVIGLGLAGQVMHLPYLRELGDRFEIAALADLSPGLLSALGERYGVTQHYTDWRQMLEKAHLDAVLVATSGSHAAPAIAAARSGLHVLVEKPLSFTPREADEMLAAAEQARVTLMVGYMKRYDPGYLHAQELLANLRERITYVQINTLHPPIEMYLAHHTILRFDDVPPEQIVSLQVDCQRLVDEALGTPHHPWLDQAFPERILGSMVHDLNALRGLLGEPEAVCFSELWDRGRCITTILRYPGDVRCQYSWTFLPGLRHYDERLSFYGDGARLHLEFPSPFLLNAPTLVLTEGMEGNVAWEKRSLVSYAEAFKEELVHFHECIANGRRPRTDGEDGRRDVLLARDIALAWQPRNGSESA